MSSTEITPQEELYHIQESTNDNGTVNVEITGWEPINWKSDRTNKVSVEFRLPTMQTEIETMAWPEKDTDDHKFVRLVRQCGYDLASADQIKGERAKYDGENLVVPKQESRTKRVSKRVEEITTSSSVFYNFWYLLFLPVTSPLLLMLYEHENISTLNRRDSAHDISLLFLINTLWFIIVVSVGIPLLSLAI